MDGAGEYQSLWLIGGPACFPPAMRVHVWWPSFILSCRVQTVTNPAPLGGAAKDSFVGGGGGGDADKASSLLGLNTVGGSNEAVLPETLCDADMRAVMRDAYQVR